MDGEARVMGGVLGFLFTMVTSSAQWVQPDRGAKAAQAVGMSVWRSHGKADQHECDNHPNPKDG